MPTMNARAQRTRKRSATGLVRLPVSQAWSCHRRGGCCREHLVPLSRAEADWIIAQDWGNDLSEQPVRRLSGWLGTATPVLAQRPDGSCVFLDENGLCRIHTRYGEEAKPLACRLFPYVFVPLGPSVRLSLRFSCPSVCGNLGSALDTSQRAIDTLWHEVRRREGSGTAVGSAPVPRVYRAVQAASWQSVEAYLDTAARFFHTAGPSIRQQCLRLAAWHAHALQALALPKEACASALDQAAIAVLQAVGQQQLDQPPPSMLAELTVRVTSARIARRDRLADRGAVPALRRAGRVLKLTCWPGRLPAFGVFGPVSLRAVRSITPEPTAEAVELLYRYLRIKLWSGQFFGTAFFGLSIHDGLVNLLFLVAVALWLARWHAAARGLKAADLEAVEAAIRHVDHHFGFDPFLAGRAHRLRLRYLWTTGQLLRLIAHGGCRSFPPEELR